MSHMSELDILQRRERWENQSHTGDRLWDRVMARCPHCWAAHQPADAHLSCGHCGYTYESSLMLLDRIYLEINALGGAPVDGPYNTAIGHALNVLSAMGAVDVETERR